jgi:hypothetical protein
MLLSLVVPEVARFFYRDAGAIQWPRSFQSVVKRWPRDGLSGAVNSIGQLSACPNTRLYHQL